MSKEISIKLNGLVGLLPRKDSATDTALIGILPTVNRGFIVEPAPGYKVTIPPHVPALKIRADSYIVNSSREPDLRFLDKREQREYLLFIFDRERLTPESSSTVQLKYNCNPIDPPYDPANTPPSRMNTNDEDDLRWVPNSITAVKNPQERYFNGFASSNYFDSGFIPKEKTTTTVSSVSVVGSVMIKTGEIFNIGNRGDFAFMVPGQTDHEWQQSVFKNLIWKLEVPDDIIEFKFLDWAGNETEVKVNTNISDTHIEIVNLELESILRIHQEATEPHPTIDFDMAVFYYLLNNIPINNMPLPHYLGGLPGDSSLCIPMMYED